MSDSHKALPGTIGWIDLTVPGAEKVRRFYEVVAGWQAEAVDMGGYSDYTMSPATGAPSRVSVTGKASTRRCRRCG